MLIFFYFVLKVIMVFVRFGSRIYYSWKAEVRFSFSGLLYSLKKEGDFDMCFNVDEV